MTRWKNGSSSNTIKRMGQTNVTNPFLYCLVVYLFFLFKGGGDFACHHGVRNQIRSPHLKSSFFFRSKHAKVIPASTRTLDIYLLTECIKRGGGGCAVAGLWIETFSVFLIFFGRSMLVMLVLKIKCSNFAPGPSPIKRREDTHTRWCGMERKKKDRTPQKKVNNFPALTKKKCRYRWPAEWSRLLRNRSHLWLYVQVYWVIDVSYLSGPGWEWKIKYQMRLPTYEEFWNLFPDHYIAVR